MMKGLLWFLGIAAVLALGAVLLGPFLISTEPSGGAKSSRALARSDSHFIEVPFPGTHGIELHYLAEGLEEKTDTRTFILLHGFTFNAFTWEPVLELFGRAGRVVAYDQVPYGLSAKLTSADWSGPNPYSRQAAVAQLFAFMDALSIERATLVGNSSGGTLALDAALDRPERVDGLILVAPWIYAQRPTVPRVLAELPQLRRLSLMLARKLGQGTLLDYSYARAERIDENRRALMTVHTAVEAWDIAWGELLNLSLSIPVRISERLREVNQPVLLLSGDKDKLVAVEDTRRAADALPNASLEILSDCGHVPQEECPDQVRRAVSAWLEDTALTAPD